MFVTERDEEKRSRIWRIVTITATIIIIVVAAYFLFDMFAGNPLKGTWASEDSNLTLTIRKGSAATAKWPAISETSDVKLNLTYAIDKDKKTIAFQISDAEIIKLAEKSAGTLSEEAIRAEVSVVDNTFDYSLEADRLTLSEREYGEQITFIKE